MNVRTENKVLLAVCIAYSIVNQRMFTDHTLGLCFDMILPGVIVKVTGHLADKPTCGQSSRGLVKCRI